MYCSVDEVLAELEAMGEEPRSSQAAERAIAAASDLIDSYTGRHFRAEPVSESHEPLGGQVLLNHWPAVEVVEVVDAEGNQVEWEPVDANIGLLRIHASGRVRVTYYYNDPQNPTPEDIRRLTARLAAKILVYPNGLKRASAGELSLEFREILGQEERWVLLKYRHLPRFV